MPSSFSILPWEPRGSDHNSAPHATTPADIGGKRREMLLKMHDRVIYFKEPHLVPVFAVTRRFERQLRGEELIEAWREETARENYGRHIARHLWFHSVPASTVLSVVHRADGSGWIKEWFSADWLETPPLREGSRLELWGKHSFHVLNRRAIARARRRFLNRHFSPGETPTIERRWKRGSEEEARRIVPVMLKLFAPTMGRHFHSFDLIPFELGACSPGDTGLFHQHAIKGRWYPWFDFSPLARRALNLLREHLLFEEVQWINRRLHSDNGERSYLNDEEIRLGNERFGDDWRGNFEFQLARVRFQIAPFGIPTAHEKLESLLELREWLDGKVSPRQREFWLQAAQN
jgi:hypothetical protein